MGAVLFDTLSYTKKLREAGVPEKQAEVQAEAIAEALSGQLATKSDVELLRKDLQLSHSELRGDFKIVKWMLGVVISANIGLALMLIKALFAK